MKKAIALLMAAVMLLVLCACSNTPKDVDETTSVDPSTLTNGTVVDMTTAQFAEQFNATLPIVSDALAASDSEAFDPAQWQLDTAAFALQGTTKVAEDEDTVIYTGTLNDVEIRLYLTPQGGKISAIELRMPDFGEDINLANYRISQVVVTALTALRQVETIDLAAKDISTIYSIQTGQPSAVTGIYNEGFLTECYMDGETLVFASAAIVSEIHSAIAFWTPLNILMNYFNT